MIGHQGHRRHLGLTTRFLHFPFVGFLAFFSPACEEEGSICEPSTVYEVKADANCYSEPLDVPELVSCRTETEKGITYECVVSPNGVPHVALRNNAASFEASTWRVGAKVTDAERAVCDDLRNSAGPPSVERQCDPDSSTD